MLNNINSQQIQNTNDIQAAWPLKKNGSRGYIEAPKYLPKYSITNALNEKDMFKKEINHYNHKKQKRKSLLNKFSHLIGITMAALAVRFLWKKY